MAGGPALTSADGLLTRDRPDDPVEVHLMVELRDGRIIDVEMPKGVRPTVDLTVGSEPAEPWLGFGTTRAVRTTEDFVRIVIEARTWDGRAEEDGCLFRFAVREPKEVDA